MTTAIYAGSFDPFTFGHLSIVTAAARMFDEVLVLVADNPEKECLFSPDERKDLIHTVIRDGFKGLGTNVRAVKYSGYIVDFANVVGAEVLVRGIRDASDVVYEMNVAEINSAFAPGIQTVFLPANRSLSEVSSSEVKRRFAAGESINYYCPPQIVRAMKVKAE
jgi:pantetheine-phosphate adenylyltransferase